MLLQPKRVHRGQKWRRLIWMLVVAALAFAGWKAWQSALPRYRTWKQQRALAQAKAFIEKHDAQNAKLALDVALSAVPGNVEATRLAAELLEQVGAAQAVRLRRLVVQMQPDSAEDQAALIYAAMKFRDFNSARDALSSLTPDMAERPATLKAALAFAIATDNRPIADALSDRLKKIFPNDDQLQLIHSTLLLKHPREERRAKAREELVALAQRLPQYALVIQRELASEAIARSDYSAARQSLTAAAAAPKAEFNEQLQLANLDLLIENKPFDPVFARLAPLAEKDADTAQQFIQWLLVQRRGAEAEKWFYTLPAAIKDAPATLNTRADIAASRNNWDQVLRFVEAGAWGGLSRGTIQLVQATRAIDTQNRPALRRETWDLALESVATNLASLRALQRLSTAWRWEAEAEACLWAIVKSFRDQTWAHQALFNIYRGRGNTVGLRNVMSALRESDPGVMRYQHDWALFSLLLEPSTTWSPQKELLAQLYKTDSTNVSVATSYAFALAQSERVPEAIAVLSKFTAEDLEYLPRQPYLAFIYGMARKAEEMNRAIKLGADGNYLPEESALFGRGQTALTRTTLAPKEKSAPKPGAGASKTPPPKS